MQVPDVSTVMNKSLLLWSLYFDGRMSISKRIGSFQGGLRPANYAEQGDVMNDDMRTRDSTHLAKVVREDLLEEGTYAKVAGTDSEKELNLGRCGFCRPGTEQASGNI